jgi:hypothetical protein
MPLCCHHVCSVAYCRLQGGCALRASLLVSCNWITTTCCCVPSPHLLPSFPLQPLQDRLEVQLGVSFLYFLIPDQLPALQRDYNLAYQPSVESNAISAVKNTAGVCVGGGEGGRVLTGLTCSC